MIILAISKLLPGVTIENFKPELVAAEAEEIWKLYASGMLREIYLRKDQPGVAIIFECADVEEAKAALALLPMIKGNILDFDFIPLGPFLSFATLFSK